MRICIQNCQADNYQKISSISAEEASIYKRRVNINPIYTFKHNQEFRKTIIPPRFTNRSSNWNQISFRSFTASNQFIGQNRHNISDLVPPTKNQFHIVRPLGSNNMTNVRNYLKNFQKVKKQVQNQVSQHLRKPSKTPFFLKNRVNNVKRNSNLCQSQGQQLQNDIIICREQLRLSKPVQNIKRVQQPGAKYFLLKKQAQNDYHFNKKLNKIDNGLQFSYKLPKRFKKGDPKNQMMEEQRLMRDSQRRISCHQFNRCNNRVKTVETLNANEKLIKSNKIISSEHGLYRASSLSNLTKISLESTQDIQRAIKQLQFKKNQRSRQQRKTYEVSLNISQTDISLKKGQSEYQKTAQKRLELIPIQQQNKTPIKGINKSGCSRAELLTLSRQFSVLFNSDCKNQQTSTSRIEQYWNQFENILFSQ